MKKEKADLQKALKQAEKRAADAEKRAADAMRSSKASLRNMQEKLRSTHQDDVSRLKSEMDAMSQTKDGALERTAEFETAARTCRAEGGALCPECITNPATCIQLDDGSSIMATLCDGCATKKKKKLKRKKVPESVNAAAEHSLFFRK